MSKYDEPNIDGSLTLEQTDQTYLTTIDPDRQVKIGIEVEGLILGLTPDQVIKRRMDAAGLKFAVDGNSVHEYKVNRFVNWLLDRVAPVH